MQIPSQLHKLCQIGRVQFIDDNEPLIGPFRRRGHSNARVIDNRPQFYAKLNQLRVASWKEGLRP